MNTQYRNGVLHVRLNIPFRTYPNLSSRPEHDGFMSCVAERPAGCSCWNYCRCKHTAGLSATAQKRAFGRDDNSRGFVPPSAIDQVALFHPVHPSLVPLVPTPLLHRNAIEYLLVHENSALLKDTLAGCTLHRHALPCRLKPRSDRKRIRLAALWKR